MARFAGHRRLLREELALQGRRRLPEGGGDGRLWRPLTTATCWEEPAPLGPVTATWGEEGPSGPDGYIGGRRRQPALLAVDDGSCWGEPPG